MHESSLVLVLLGSILLLGLATDYLGRATSLPRVTLLMLFGVLLGPEILQLIPSGTERWSLWVTNVALLLVGFLLGGKVSLRLLARNGKAIVYISLSVVMVTVLVVAGGLWLAGTSLSIALILAGIATATDPAATLDVTRESKATGPFTDALLGIVAIDDAWGLIVFSVLLALAQISVGVGEPILMTVSAFRELSGALVLGVLLGVPAALLTGRIKPGEPTLVEALGVVFLCGGLAQYFQVSFLLTAMVLGATVANLANHHERPFHAIEDIEWPFRILFFVFTGASLEFENLSGLLPLTLMYILLRTLGRFIGSYPGGWLAGAGPTLSRWMGCALLPQAGVANGMALLASSAIPELRQTLLPVAIVSTVFFELTGPICTRLILRRVSEVQ